MTDTIKATRRSFLRNGVLVAAPLAATAIGTVALAEGSDPQRLSRLEAEAAIRAAHQAWLRQVNTGGNCAGLEGVHRIAAHHAAVPDRLQIGADTTRAMGHYDCSVDLDVSLPRDCTLAQMAHAQGHGTVRRTERRMLTVEYHRTRAGWTIGNATLA